jgi:tetratricopeptide (TPR) repeat protein
METSLRDNGHAEQCAIEAFYKEGFRLLADERYEAAAAFFHAMLQTAPTDERGWVALGECHERLGQPRIALELYSAGSIAARPAPRCLLSRFRALYDMNQFSEAQCAYDQALQIAASRGDETFGFVLENERRQRP